MGATNEHIASRQIDSALTIVYEYDGIVPFAVFLKEYFREHKKFGSRDRKSVAALCYAWFRLGKAWPVLERHLRMKVALLLCNAPDDPLVQAIFPDFKLNAQASVSAKLQFLSERLSLPEFSVADIFPFTDLLSAGIDAHQFSLSFLVQPKVFVRVRPGRMEKIESTLYDAQIDYEKINQNSLSVPTGVDINAVLPVDRDVVVQDLSSQGVGAVFQEAVDLIGHDQVKAWDCCAASGGKSIMLFDITPSVKLTATDIRESIIANLRKRFEVAGISRFHSSVMDVSKHQHPVASYFNFLIADVPCTGSGTWARTPEQLRFFKREMIDHYVQRQRDILSHTLPALSNGGYLCYITCSVFAAENEAQVKWLKEKHRLQVVTERLLIGYPMRADSMYVCLLRK
jgi:16S rRNA (cytosine967-C5)-methyltransferase